MTTVTRYNDQFISHVGDGWDGVGLVATASKFGSGSLLMGGRAVLTAAHVVENSAGPVRVAFDTPSGRQWLPVESVHLHADYSEARFANDLALLWFGEAAPLSIPRYTLYRGSDELSQVATLVGYGITGTGEQGYVTGSGGVRTMVQNRLDTTQDALDQMWGPRAPVGSQLLSDFDNGTARYDSFDRLLGLTDTGLGRVEGLIAPGDSGGPAFLGGKIAGVASYTSQYMLQNGERLDVNATLDSSFGEVAAWQRVSHYQTWIDETLARLEGDLTGAVDLSATDAENITLLYASALDRRPEEAGLNYWVDQSAGGMQLTSIAGAFADSPEFMIRFGARDNAGYIERLYLNSLDRHPDQAGFDYWRDAMDNGVTKAEVLLGFALSEENRGNTPWLEDLYYDAENMIWTLADEALDDTFAQPPSALAVATVGHTLDHGSIDTV
ncbi:DUF4214 domain-containing protein [Larsenimonas salina]|uniref:DUF4214 domain-containing protein n=1 Tax=Larsenimonas salina TaxID=1295565 RepID=UPI002073FD6A|nr:DUF4214 domain-containing protein [Larsenimonas salina]MCM5704924.1 DUF4214 domain-containing protein [Larsenimonas salina]